MNLDNEPLVVGDTPWDLLLGRGTVLTTVNGRADVRFSDGRTVEYTGNGMNISLNSRTLYWHNPISIIPPKNDNRFRFQREVWDYLNDAFSRNCP